MRYLLDVNALIALGIDHHVFHPRVENWLTSLASNSVPKLGTCSITELGFVRIASQVSAYSITLDQARTLLKQLKKSKSYNFRFIGDNNDISRLPAWVKLSKQSTDGHLFQLAKSNRAVLATFDEGIPDAFVIP